MITGQGPSRRRATVSVRKTCMRRSLPAPRCDTLARFFSSLSRACLVVPRRNPDRCPTRGRTRRPAGAGASRRGPARRRRHRALHRALPQGGHRRPRRHPAARARDAAGLPARARGAPRRGAQEHRRAGQADARAASAIAAAPTKQELEDLYLPYKPKRRTKGAIAREAGLEPLADRLFADPALDPAGAKPRRSSMPRPDSPTRTRCSTACATCWPSAGPRTRRWSAGCANGCGPRACSRPSWRRHAGKDEHSADVAKFRDYFDYAEPIAQRALAPRAGGVPRPHAGSARRAAGARRRQSSPASPAWPRAASRAHLGWRHQARAGDELIRKCVAWTWKVKLSLSLERDLFARLREAGRGRRDQGLRRQPARPAAGRAGRQARRDGAGPRHPHRRQGGGGQRHRQGAGHGHRLPARAAARLGRCAAHAGAAGGARTA